MTPQNDSASTRNALQSALPTEAEASVDISQWLPDVAGPGSRPETLQAPGGGATGGPTAGQVLGQANQARTTVFGVTGQGRRFAYVFDRSGSMSGFQGRPLAAAKRELLASVNDLGEQHQFLIIFYNFDQEVFRFRGGPASWVWATDDAKDAARLFVDESIEAFGSTRHIPPLKMALGMRPDVIFFLTDASGEQSDLSQIARFNDGACVIHVIEFGSGAADTSRSAFRQLAEQNQGQHVYVDVRRLGPS